MLSFYKRLPGSKSSKNDTFLNFLLMIMNIDTLCILIMDTYYGFLNLHETKNKISVFLVFILFSLAI